MNVKSQTAGRLDLHTHSTASDGALSPSQLVSEAEKVGILALALTDHDTVEGVEEFLAAADSHPALTLLGGVEISLEYPNEFHLLAYNARGAPGIPSELGRLQGFRDDRNRIMLEKIRALGYDLSWERLKELSGTGQLGRPHFAAALLEKGYFKKRQDVFDELLAKGRPGYVDKIRLTPAEGLAMTRAAAWTPVLAHPFTLRLSADDWPAFMRGLVDMGLLGVEVFHPGMSEEESRFFQALAKRFDLIATAGSDFHGATKPHISLNWVREHSALGMETIDRLRR